MESILALFLSSEMRPFEQIFYNIRFPVLIVTLEVNHKYYLYRVTDKTIIEGTEHDKIEFGDNSEFIITDGSDKPTNYHLCENKLVKSND